MSGLGKPGITWRERVANLRVSLGRDPTLQELLEVNAIHTMTPDEVQAQRESWVRAMRSTGDPRLD
jgi:hypothetical protein